MIATLLLVACLQAPTLDAEAGFQGTVFPDSWTRVAVTVAYEGDPVDAELRVTVRSFSSDPVVYQKPLRLVRKVRMRTGVDIYLTASDYNVEVDVVAKDKFLRQQTPPLIINRDDNRRLLVVGTPPSIVIDALAKRPPVTMVRLPAELLPSSALTLRCVESILIPEPISLDPGQELALEEWIRQGGRLIFGAGRSTFLRQDSFWKGLCPLAAPEVGTMPVTGKDGEIALTLVRGKQTKGRTGSSLGNSPLVFREARGAGEVVFIPFVLEQTHFSTIVSGAPLLAELLNLPPPPKEELIPRRGYVPREEWLLSDRRGLMTETTENFLRRLVPPDWSLSFSALAGGVLILLVYVGLIGPFEYLRLRRGGRLRQGWLSLAALVLLFGGLVYAWSRWVSPQTSRMSIVSILDADRVRTFAAFRPARGDLYDVKSAGSLTVLPPLRAYGATEALEPTTVLLPSDALLPIPPSDTRLFVASRPLASGEAGMNAIWRDTRKKAVTIRNAADFSLEECWALSKDEAWLLGRVAAGTTVTIDLGTPIDFRSWASRQFVDPTHQIPWWYSSNRWDGVRPDRFGLVLTFYEAFHSMVSDVRYRNVLQDRSLDWSSVIAAGEVVVVGSFVRNLSQIQVLTGPEPQVSGWARMRVGEATP